MRSLQRGTVVAAVVTAIGILVPVTIGVAFFDHAGGSRSEGLSAKAVADGRPRPVEQVRWVRGDGDLVEAVIEAAPILLVQQRLIGASPDLSPASLDAARAAIPAQVRAVYASSRVVEAIEVFNESIESLRRNPDQAYNRDCRFRFDDVLGVHIDSPTTATISFQGSVSVPARITSYSYPGVTTPDGWEVVPPHIFNMALVLEAEGWRILNLTETNLDGKSLAG